MQKKLRQRILNGESIELRTVIYSQDHLTGQISIVAASSLYSISIFRQLPLLLET